MADVQVVLLETVPNLGDIGDVRSVAGGYARNFLLPRRLAVPATRQRLDDSQFQSELQDRREENARREAQHLADMIQGATLTIYVQGWRPGAHARPDHKSRRGRRAARAAWSRDRSPSHPDRQSNPPSLGRYLVPIRLAAGLEASVMLDVVEQEDEPEPVEEDDEEAAEDDFGVSNLGR